ncbi:hypothetical protein BpHYR1_030641 [Brachionus plicatilis]|uniref:Uncharacterized protein n=1 Tax=Brachionus plicatilis TaxID=10195 RepID=A0A3M7Q8E3_BRAPC|nr:hypothetical protein BpHYR1_030641 [Brachionus plicatilis]
MNCNFSKLSFFYFYLFICSKNYIIFFSNSTRLNNLVRIKKFNKNCIDVSGWIWFNLRAMVKACFESIIDEFFQILMTIANKIEQKAELHQIMLTYN